MTKVIKRVRDRGRWVIFLIPLMAVSWLNAREGGGDGSAAVPPTETPASLNSAAALYQQLRTVGLDQNRVFRIRDANLDRGGCHISLDTGTIAFTQDIAGRITGAFFEGEGEVLLSPSASEERRSLALFTGGAILEESFGSAYFRFDDNTFAELQPTLAPADDPQGFVLQWNEAARNLAQLDGLALFVSFSRYLSGTNRKEADSHTETANGHLFHARFQGRKLGGFDVYFDAAATEPLWVGQIRVADGESFYDLWTASPPSHNKDNAGGVVSGLAEQTESDKVGVQNYRIRAVVKPPLELDAEAWLQMEVRQGGERAVLFELSRSLVVKQVEANGIPVEFIHNPALDGTQLARRGNDLIAVVFPRALSAGEKINLHFSYGGEVLSEAGNGLLYVGARGTWYPNRGMQMSNFDLEFHFPAGWTLVATGKRAPVSSGETGHSKAAAIPGEQVMRWISERPIPVAGFNLGRYSRATARAGEVTVETYATPTVERSFPTEEDRTSETPDHGLPSVFRRDLENTIVLPSQPSPARNAQAVADLSARAIEFFARSFGPYPYSSLALTQMPGNTSQGWPSLIFLSSFSFLTSEEQSRLHMSPTERIMNGTIVAHETAHQWWGDLVVWKSYRDQWLAEALANYSALMLLESQDPPKAHTLLEKYRDDLLMKNKDGIQVMDAGPVTLGIRLTSSHFPNGYETIAYGRGTWLMHMLRNMMRDGTRKHSSLSDGAADGHVSDEPFLRALRNLRERYQGKPISTHEMLKVFEDELPPSLWYGGKKSLDWFYDGWVNGAAIPRLELQSVKYADKPNAVAINGTILQKDAPDELVTAVPVYASLGVRPIFLGIVFADGSETTFHLSAPAGARKVVLDPYHTILTR